MRLLLDTHAIIWYAQGLPSLSPSARDAMEREECHFSIASLWEIAIKQRLGKLNFAASIPAMTNFTDDPAALYRWRDEMADLIEEANAK